MLELRGNIGSCLIICSLRGGIFQGIDIRDLVIPYPNRNISSSIGLLELYEVGLL